MLNAGADALKLFPAEGASPAMLRAIIGRCCRPVPWCCRWAGRRVQHAHMASGGGCRVRHWLGDFQAR